MLVDWCVDRGTSVNLKSFLIKRVGPLAYRFAGADRWSKRLVHLYAIFSSGRFTRGSICLLENEQREFLLVETTYRRGIGFVGGLPLNRAEQPLDTAIREVDEEVGLKLGRRPHFVGVYVQQGLRHIDSVFYTQVSAAEAAETTMSDGELRSMRWTSLDEAIELLDEDGRGIVDVFVAWREGRPSVENPRR